MENIDLTQGPIDTPPQKNTSVFQFALKWVVILALIEIVFSLLLYVTNQMENRAIVWLGYLIMGGIAFVAVKNYRDKESGGYISFGKGFNVGFQVIFFAGIVTAIYTYIFFKYIDPTMIDHMKQMTEQRMLDKGMPDDQVEMAMKYTKMFMSPGVFAIGGIIGSAVIGAIVSLIVAAIAKRENKQLLPPQ